MNKEKSIKIVLLGDGGTGKTSYVARVCREGFHEQYVATLGYECTDVLVDTAQHGTFSLRLWDTAGQEKAGHLRDAYYDGAQAAILFFDVTSRVTYKNVPMWHRDVLRVCGDSLPVVLFANKVDVVERKVRSKAITYHEKHESVHLVEGSVKERIGLKLPVEYLLQKITRSNDLKVVSSLESDLFATFEAIDMDGS